MNARGKQLTDFENFKADLTKWMKNDNNPHTANFNKDAKLDGREVKYHFSISQKLDTHWTAFLWQMTKDFDINLKDKDKNLVYPDGKAVDPLFMRLFYRYFLHRYILSSSSNTNTMDKETDYKSLYEEGKFKNFDVFEKLLNDKFEVINDFEYFLDKLKTNWIQIENSINPSWSDKKWSFLDDNITQSGRVIFLAICLFLEQKKEFDVQRFRYWMRTVWNIVENSYIDSATSMIGVMKLIVELSLNSYDIYAFLENKDNRIVSISSDKSVSEERKKSSFIINNPAENWEEEFIIAEKHPFFKGAISFFITDNMPIEEFKHRREMAFLVFDENGKGINEKYKGKGHLFLRAIISRCISIEQIIGKNFTDIQEPENYLKKMLATEKVVRDATREWFSLPNEDVLFENLRKEVSKASVMTIPNDIDLQRRARKVHEDLYKNENLQKWMQQAKAIRVDWRDGKIYIFRPYSWYTRVLLDGYQNEIMSYLQTNFSCVPINCQCTIDNNSIFIPFFSGSEEVKLARKIRINEEDYEFEYKFDRKFVSVGLKKTIEISNKFENANFTSDEKDEGWICRKKYDYQEEVKSEQDIEMFVKKIEEEVFNLLNTDSLIAKLKKEA
jgi:hypothetical protein